MATNSSTLAWKIPWMEEPGRLQSMGSLRVGHDWSDLAAAANLIKFHSVYLIFKELKFLHIVFARKVSHERFSDLMGNILFSKWKNKFSICRLILAPYDLWLLPGILFIDFLKICFTLWLNLWSNFTLIIVMIFIISQNYASISFSYFSAHYHLFYSIYSS